MASIDLNCDMGEGFGNYAMPCDELLMQHISSANIACGFHAGDAQVMEQTVQLAIKNGVAIGAHPGLPDLPGFGRREMKISAKEAYQLVLYQVGALSGFVTAAKAKLNHVKPHGALYNMAAKDSALAEAIAQAVYDFDKDLKFYALSGSAMITAAKKIGLKPVSEVFADRTYQDDGSLSPRSSPDALIIDYKLAIRQAIRMVKEQQIISLSGKQIPIVAQTLCLHGDGEHAVEFAVAIREALINEGIKIIPPSL